MSLVTCRECQREVSDRARACPHCGSPVTGREFSAALATPKQEMPEPTAASLATEESPVDKAAKLDESPRERPKQRLEIRAVGHDRNPPLSPAPEIFSKRVAYGFLFVGCGIVSVGDGAFGLLLLDDTQNPGATSGTLLGILAAFVAGFASFRYGHDVLKTGDSRFKDISAYKVLVCGIVVAVAALVAGVLLAVTISAIRSAARAGLEQLEFDREFKESRQAAQQFIAAHPKVQVGLSLTQGSERVF